jgi:hypothetical protein
VTRAGAALALLAFVALAAAGCTAFRHLDVDQVRALVGRFDCRDGAPARILVDPHCQQGICGVTCAPDRWTVPGR